ncbi:MAG TPA: class I SAM-dependent methyltransferase [Pyrinomonadaceae bacterium]|nr:class I SAM-dependent methyltransferase [Pyrinomonadaceae bacterium]
MKDVSERGYEVLSNTEISNDVLEIQAAGENNQAIIQALPLKNAKRILEIGCGTGCLSMELAQILGDNTQVFGIDVSPEHIEFARRKAKEKGIGNVHYFVGDILQKRKNWKGNFDLIYEKYVLMYTTREDKTKEFLTEIKYYLKKGGKIVCIEPDVNFGYERFPVPPKPLADVLPKIVEYYQKNDLIDWRCGIKLFYYFKLAAFSGIEIKLVDGRIIAGGSPRELAEHAAHGIEDLIKPCLKELGIEDSEAQVVRQWNEYLNKDDTFLYTPIFVGQAEY